MKSLTALVIRIVVVLTSLARVGGEGGVARKGYGGSKPIKLSGGTKSGSALLCKYRTLLTGHPHFHQIMTHSTQYRKRSVSLGQ